MSRRTLAIAATVVAAAVAGVVLTRPTPVAFPPLAATGGILDLDSGQYLLTRDDGQTSATIVEYRSGGRLRLPVIVTPAEAVEITGIAVDLPATSAVRASGAVIGLHKYVLDEGTEPFHPVRVAKDGDAFFGVDVEMCCLPRTGWVEVLRGVRITYRHAGRTWTAFQPFSETMPVVIRW